MSSDEQTARQALQNSMSGSDVPLTQIPAYVEWSARKLKEGEEPALIANLDATSTWVSPGEILTDEDFDEMLEDVKEAVKQLGGEVDWSLELPAKFQS